MDKRFILSHPILFGVFISLLLFIANVVTSTWAPWIWEYNEQHKILVQAVFFTAFNFAVYIYVFREWRQRALFWLLVCTVLLLHSLGVYFYSTRVQPILVWQWPMIAVVECYAIIFSLLYLAPPRPKTHHGIVSPPSD